MGQNTSTAVMQRRRVAPDSLDYFPTPPWATRALCEFLASIGEPIGRQSVWEPACGEKHMVHPLCGYFERVRASDVHDYGDHQLLDFLLLGDHEPPADWIISNPPFNLADQFIHVGRRNASRGVAMLLRCAFLEGQERYETLFADTPPDYVLQFTERVCMLQGRLVRYQTVDPFAAIPGTKANSATAYTWFVWLTGGAGDTRLRWIAPCRLRLERPGDYPDYAQGAAEAAGSLI